MLIASLCYNTSLKRELTSLARSELLEKTVAVPISELRILFQKSGNRCAFPACRRLLTAEGNTNDPDVSLGEVAHIVGESPNGPRGDSPLTTAERNRYVNLILLCHQHHQLIDDQPHTYTIARLLQMRQDHEAWVEKTLRQGGDGRLPTDQPQQKLETIYSTLLPVIRMPRYVYGGACTLQEERLLSGPLLRSLREEEMAPAILRAGQLFTFQNLHDPANPFASLVSTNDVERYDAQEWWDNPDRLRWFVALLNRSLNKLTGRKHLNYDRRHHRYYFQPVTPGEPLEIDYQPLNQQQSSRQVVWQPIRRSTGEARGYWYHRAVALQFLLISPAEWCLSIRPELHVTTDGITPFASEKIGSKVTKKKARMFNYDLLSEVNFWRSFLSESSPRILFHFGPYHGRYPSQHLVVSTSFMQGNIRWPGIPEEHARPFRNVEFLDTLFTWAAYAELESDDRADEWEEEEEGAFWEGGGHDDESVEE